ncbi:MAG: Holliday junction DNA helicase RuvA [Cyclobacteriaceae bacterium]|jgi:Holliday junction DNA helicase RuvA
MIAYLEGNLVVKEPTHLIVDIQGLGYEVKISLNTYSAVKAASKAKIYTHFHVKEDAQTLYGFSEYSEKVRFLDLISISGVGPSIALMILSSLSPEELQSAIAAENTGVIQSVKGVGAKTAQRIILELKDKMKKEGILGMAIENTPSANNSLKNEALSALTTLGIGKAVAEKTVMLLLREHQDLSLEQLIKLALKRA